MTTHLPPGIVTSSESIAPAIGSIESVDEEDIRKLWRAYATNRHVLPNGTGRRLENMFWRIWSSPRISRRIRGSTLARIFLSISDDRGIIRTTPVQSPRQTRDRASPSPPEKASPPRNPSTSPEKPRTLPPILKNAHESSPSSCMHRTVSNESESSTEKKITFAAPKPPTPPPSSFHKHDVYLSQQQQQPKKKKTATFAASTGRRRPVYVRRKSSASSGTGSGSGSGTGSSIRSVGSMRSGTFLGSESPVEREAARLSSKGSSPAGSGRMLRESLAASDSSHHLPRRRFGDRSQTDLAHMGSAPLLVKTAPTLASTPSTVAGTIEYSSLDSKARGSLAQVTPATSTSGPDNDGIQGLQRTKSQLAVLLERDRQAQVQAHAQQQLQHQQHFASPSSVNTGTGSTSFLSRVSSRDNASRRS